MSVSTSGPRSTRRSTIEARPVDLGPARSTYRVKEVPHVPCLSRHRGADRRRRDLGRRTGRARHQDASRDDRRRGNGLDDPDETIRFRRGRAMPSHTIVTREEWLEARKTHLAKEKEFTRLRDRLSAERRALPWVRVDKPYVFEGPSGKATLADLFGGRRQLIVYHFMFGPGWA